MQTTIITGLGFFSEDAPAQNTETAAENISETTEQSEEKGNPEAEFEELIKGRYASAFAKRTQGIIDRRFAKLKGFEKTANDVKPLIEALSKSFPDISPDDIGALTEAFLEKENSASKAEEKKTEQTKLTAAAERIAEERAKERLIAGWEKQAEEIKEIYPSFSLPDEMKNNELFGRLLKNGLTVRQAFETANLEKIMGAAMKYAAEVSGRKAAAALRDSGRRVQENSVLDRASSVTRKDVSALTEKDIMKIINEVSRGAKISF